MVRPVLVAVLLLVPLVPLVAAEDPTTGQCDRVNVPLNVNIGLVCALAGAGSNAQCPPGAGHAITVTCSSVASWSWLAYSTMELAGAVDVTVAGDVLTCLDLVGAEPACESHPFERNETCTWQPGGECRGSERLDAAWGPVDLAMGEEFKVLVHVEIRVHATSNAQGVPVGEAEYAESSDWGDAVGVVCDGRDC